MGRATFWELSRESGRVQLGGGYDQHILYVCIKSSKNKKELEICISIYTPMVFGILQIYCCYSERCMCQKVSILLEHILCSKRP